jgi:hypothetical protein
MSQPETSTKSKHTIVNHTRHARPSHEADKASVETNVEHVEKNNRVHRRLGGHSGGPSTRSHPELGRETRPRQWYFGLSRGRVGRRQVFHEHEKHEHRNITDIQTPNNAPSPKRFAKKKGRALINDLRSPTNAGWSSPVARQAHNLKVAGSNPAPATKYIKPLAPKRRGLFACGQAMGKRDDPRPRKITRTGGPRSEQQLNTRRLCHSNRSGS